jgi:hypothetical protein
LNPDFSERQYEAAVNQEITLGLGSMLAHPLPVIPSTKEEHRLGWDAKFEAGSYWYFLQYKIAVHATRRTSWNAHFWAVHRRDYFRFDLLSNSQGLCHQHQRLAELRERQPGVYYCSPLFATEADFWKYVGEEDVFWNSALIDVASARLSSLWGRHQISYDSSGRVQPWSESGEGSEKDRTPSIRRDPANLRRVNASTLATLVADSAVIGVRTGLPEGAAGRLGSSLLARRLSPEIRERVRTDVERVGNDELAPMLAELLTPGELIATAGRILALDFELAFFIEPANHH